MSSGCMKLFRNEIPGLFPKDNGSLRDIHYETMAVHREEEELVPWTYSPLWQHNYLGPKRPQKVKSLKARPPIIESTPNDDD